VAKKKNKEEIKEGVLTEAEIDRVNMPEIIQKNLQGFLGNLVERVSTQDDMTSIVKDEILSRIQDPEEKITTQNLLQLFEILSEHKLRGETNIISLLKEQYKVEALKRMKDMENDEGGEKSSSDENLSADDVKKAVSAIGVLDKFKKDLDEVKKGEYVSKK
jgi:hypothetical protein